MSDPVWPDLPGARVTVTGPDGEPLPGAEVTFTELGRTKYSLYADGTETLEVWERGSDGGLVLTGAQVTAGAFQPHPPGWQSCRVYWGSHGCARERGHDGDCEDDCCDCGGHHPYPDWPDTSVLCVAKAPYYGPETRFYGEDVKVRGLPGMDDD